MPFSGLKTWTSFLNHKVLYHMTSSLYNIAPLLKYPLFLFLQMNVFPEHTVLLCPAHAACAAWNSHPSTCTGHLMNSWLFLKFYVTHLICESNGLISAVYAAFAKVIQVPDSDMFTGYKELYSESKNFLLCCIIF